VLKACRARRVAPPSKQLRQWRGIAAMTEELAGRRRPPRATPYTAPRADQQLS